MATDVNASHEEQWARHLAAVGRSVELLDRESDPAVAGGVLLYEVRFKLDADEGTSCLAILKGTSEAGNRVGFVGGADLASTLIATARKIGAGAVKWREDRPWGDR